MSADQTSTMYEKALAKAKKDARRWLRILNIARDEYEANYGRIVSDRDPHWTVMLRRALKRYRAESARSRQ